MTLISGVFHYIQLLCTNVYEDIHVGIECIQLFMYMEWIGAHYAKRIKMLSRTELASLKINFAVGITYIFSIFFSLFSLK